MDLIYIELATLAAIIALFIADNKFKTNVSELWSKNDQSKKNTL